MAVDPLRLRVQSVIDMTREHPPNRQRRPGPLAAPGYCPGVTVLLATCDEWPEGEPGAPALDAALAARDVDARWVRWDDDGVDWPAADLVAVRSTWDYIHRPDELLAWARRVETATVLLNGADVFGWNVDKAYLTALGDVPVVPDRRAGRARRAGAGGRCGRRPGRGQAADQREWPRRGGGRRAGRPQARRGRRRAARRTAARRVDPHRGRALRLRPRRPRARTDPQGAAGGRHPGARVPRCDRDGGAARRRRGGAGRACRRRREAAGRPDDRLCAARPALLEGAWCVGELEAIEPGLYLDVLPATAEPFADLVVDRLKAIRRVRAEGRASFFPS